MAKIVTFIGRATRDIRREATERVRRSGIWTKPKQETPEQSADRIVDECMREAEHCGCGDIGDNEPCPRHG